MKIIRSGSWVMFDYYGDVAIGLVRKIWTKRGLRTIRNAEITMYSKHGRHGLTEYVSNLTKITKKEAINIAGNRIK